MLEEEYSRRRRKQWERLINQNPFHDSFFLREGVTLKSIDTSPLKKQFDTGAVRDTDEGKEDYIESISWLTMKRYANYMKEQEVKYGRGNWIKGIPISSYEQSLMRHLQKYLANKYNGGSFEIEVDHLAAAMFNLQGLIHEEEKLKLI